MVVSRYTKSRLGLDNDWDVSEGALIEVCHVDAHVPNSSCGIDPVDDQAAFAAAMEFDGLGASAVAHGWPFHFCRAGGKIPPTRTNARAIVTGICVDRRRKLRYRDCYPAAVAFASQHVSAPSRSIVPTALLQGRVVRYPNRGSKRNQRWLVVNSWSRSCRGRPKSNARRLPRIPIVFQCFSGLSPNRASCQL